MAMTATKHDSLRRVIILLTVVALVAFAVPFGIAVYQYFRPPERGEFMAWFWISWFGLDLLVSAAAVFLAFKRRYGLMGVCALVIVLQAWIPIAWWALLPAAISLTLATILGTLFGGRTQA